MEIDRFCSPNGIEICAPAWVIDILLPSAWRSRPPACNDNNLLELIK